MDKIRALTVLVIAEMVVLASLSFAILSGGLGGSDGTDMRTYLQDVTEEVSSEAFKPTSTSPPIDIVLGNGQMYTIRGDRYLEFYVDPSWAGFVFVYGSDALESWTVTLFDARNHSSGPGVVGGGSVGLKSSGQLFLKDQMDRGWPDEDNWNGTWGFEVTYMYPKGTMYVMVTPILWFDPEYP